MSPSALPRTLHHILPIHPSNSSASWDILTVEQHAQQYCILLVVDTACQLTVTSQRMLEQIPRQFTQKEKESELFRFGIGTATSHERCACRCMSCSISAITFALDILGAELSFTRRKCQWTNVPGKPCLELINVGGHLGMKFWFPVHDIAASAVCDVSVSSDQSVSLPYIGFPIVHASLPAVHVTLRARDLPLCVPTCTQRTILPQQESLPTCGLVIGAYTTRGRGIIVASYQRTGSLGPERPGVPFSPFQGCTKRSQAERRLLWSGKNLVFGSRIRRTKLALATQGHHRLDHELISLNKDDKLLHKLHANLHELFSIQ
eukprot:6478447-Amphidinium_carterae.1